MNGLIFALDQIGQLAEHQAAVIAEQQQIINDLRAQINE